MGRYLDQIKNLESGGVPHLQNLQKPQNSTSVGFVGTHPPASEKSKQGFDGFVGTPSPRFEKSQSPPNHQTKPHITLEELPARLIDAAIRVCREVHQDTDPAVQDMLEDLTWSDPADWEKLINHFEHHPAIAYCGVGVKSGNPAGGWWATDLHPCAQREVRTPGKAIHNEEPTC